MDFSENDFEMMWVYRTKEDEAKRIKTFFPVCVCGNKNLMYAVACIRCHACGRGHSYQAFQKKKEECYRLSRFHDGHTRKFKQYKPPQRATPVRINLRTGETTKITWKEYAEAKRPTKTYTCPKCKKQYSWTGAHYAMGISPPLIRINNEEMCFPCARTTFFSEK